MGWFKRFLGIREVAEGLPPRSPHLDERWGLVFCPIIGRKTIIGLYPERGGHPGPILGCYRSRLCESEIRDCWYARPMESEIQPFDFASTAEKLAAEGVSSNGGLMAVEVIVQGDVPLADKITMLEELMAFPRKLSVANYTPEEALKASKLLRGQGD